jgi:hypothetical protein
MTIRVLLAPVRVSSTREHRAIEAVWRIESAAVGQGHAPGRVYPTSCTIQPLPSGSLNARKEL